MMINLIFPNQLFKDLSVLEKNKTFIVEDADFFSKYNFHKNKLLLHRATMKFYENYLKNNGFNVEYIEFNKNWIEILKQKKIDKVVTYELNNWELEEKIKKSGLNISYKKSDSFLCTNKEFSEFFAGKNHYSQTSFYIFMRKNHKILVDKNLKPEGGKWTFDKDNREKMPENVKTPQLPKICENIYVKEAKNYIDKHFLKNIGTYEFFNYPTTYEELDFWVDDFIKNRFENFGRYQDAIIETDSFLFHSNLSFALNIGLITPMQLLKKIISANVPLNSKEGYIRQIIGWREFVKGIYHIEGKNGMEQNFWGFENSISYDFYTGKTGILPVDNVINKLLKTGYANHIERLMVLGNFFLISETNPKEVYKWFMEISIDSYPWVMYANVFGMSQFSDGGKIVTKPYISSSNYLKKMSNFKSGGWQNTFDSLFWRFIKKHKTFFESNPRSKFLVANLNKKSEDEIQKYTKTADDFLKK